MEQPKTLNMNTGDFKHLYELVYFICDFKDALYKNDLTSGPHLVKRLSEIINLLQPVLLNVKGHPKLHFESHLQYALKYLSLGNYSEAARNFNDILYHDIPMIIDRA